jgi:predicted O-methyltransferase YrrM
VSAAVLLQIVALDIEQYMKDFSAPYFVSSGLSDRIEVLVGSAQQSLQQLTERGTR